MFRNEVDITLFQGREGLSKTAERQARGRTVRKSNTKPSMYGLLTFR